MISGVEDREKLTAKGAKGSPRAQRKAFHHREHTGTQGKPLLQADFYATTISRNAARRRLTSSIVL